LDEELAKILEPGASKPIERLETLKIYKDATIFIGSKERLDEITGVYTKSFPYHQKNI